MNTQPEAPATAHPSVRRWIYLRGLLIGLLVAAWWILFAPDSLMERELKVVLGIVAGLIGAGSYLFNLRKALVPPSKE
jgi:hypothetical protein